MWAVNINIKLFIFNIIYYYIKTAILFGKILDTIFQYFCTVEYLVTFTGTYYQYGPVCKLHIFTSFVKIAIYKK